MSGLKELLHRFCKEEFSDLHLTEEGAPYVRIHGELLPLAGAAAVSGEKLREMSRELVGEEKFEAFMREGELDMAVTFEERRIRVNVYRQQGKISWSLRLLPAEFFPLDKLGLPPQILHSACTMQKGLVLVTGSTGSGKSTTLASIINRINQTRNCHIFTIEDPVEYLHQNQKAFVSQREVGSDTAGFEEALRRVLREDPDVVLIGEMRDQTTMRAALTLAETGHLTFATLHTSEAVQTVTRMIGAFPANEQEQIRTQLAATLNLVISQQLLPWSDGKGRSLAAEILVGTPAVKAMIRENKIHQIPSSIQTGQSFGMRTMNTAILELVKQGKITPERALEWSIDREDLRRALAMG